MKQLNVLNVTVSFHGRVIARGIDVILFVLRLQQVVVFLIAIAKSIRNRFLLAEAVLVVMLKLVAESVWMLVLELLLFLPKLLHHSSVLFVSVRFCVKVIAQGTVVILFALECCSNVVQRLKVVLLMRMEWKGVEVLMVVEVLLMEIGMSVVWNIMLTRWLLAEAVEGMGEMVLREVKGKKGAEGEGLGLAAWSFAKYAVAVFPEFRD